MLAMCIHGNSYSVYQIKSPLQWSYVCLKIVIIIHRHQVKLSQLHTQYMKKPMFEETQVGAGTTIPGEDTQQEVEEEDRAEGYGGDEVRPGDYHSTG